MSVIVIGAGAAGLMTAIVAARCGKAVTVVETRPEPGAKIRVSGGGRCNVLPSRVSVDDFHTKGSRHVMRNIVMSWPLAKVRAFFEDDLRIPLKDEPSGKVFPVSDRSRDVVEALLAALRKSGGVLRTSCRIERIERRDTGGFQLVSSDGRKLECDQVVLASGGLSLPKSGSDGAGLNMAVALGHGMVPTYPALVPLLSNERRWNTLSGVSLCARVKVERDRRTIDEAEGEMLFTHRGFSGPVILDMSHYVTRDRDVALRVHWGGCDVDDWSSVLGQGGRATVASTVRRHLSRRLAALLIDHAAIEPTIRLSELRLTDREQLADVLSRFVLPVNGSEGYATAEVTGGGIPLAEISPQTLESRVVPGLYLCGEIIDVAGRLGGYNFLWAWVTGHKVGRALAAAG
ncbi:MAG: NAD(P)/FAD-dependent oxidoreductase [Candidatus Krumholzibacteria bacterium]|nr:NAD(P)/FAD-dependent oxidoreductase [Candidatus Krumholzibacteria bacterium]